MLQAIMPALAIKSLPFQMIVLYLGACSNASLMVGCLREKGKSAQNILVLDMTRCSISQVHLYSVLYIFAWFMHHRFGRKCNANSFVSYIECNWFMNLLTSFWVVHRIKSSHTFKTSYGLHLCTLNPKYLMVVNGVSHASGVWLKGGI